MNAITLLCSLMLQLIPAPAPVAVDALPGTSFAQPPAGTVLRTNPGADFPGVVTLDGKTVVRVGELRGTYREVFVPQGFPVYVHTDYLSLSPSDATASLTGDRVNLRLLPSTEGLAPLTQISKGGAPMVLLGRVNEWARVIAPMDIPLYAAPESLPAPADAAAASATWTEQAAAREQQRQAAIAGWRATDPDYQREATLLDEVGKLADTDLSKLDAAGRASRRARITELRAGATWERTRSILDTLAGDLDAADRLSAAGSRATEQVKEEARAQPAAPADSEQVASLKKESRMLALGFRFRGKGDAVSRSGSVHKEGMEGAPVYTLHGKDGEIIKLTAPPEVATLEALVGKQVELDGRRLFLTTVDGPVLVIDKVVSYRPR